MKVIPVIDFTDLSTKNGRVPSQANWISVAAEVNKALSTIGFMYLINHDVDQQKISSAFETSKRFFELPTVVKNKFLKTLTNPHEGYVKPGQEILHPDSSHEIRESFDFMKDSWPHEDTDGTDVTEFHYANIELKNDCKSLIKKLLRILAMSLDLEDEEFFINSSMNVYDKNIPSYSNFRTINYPQVGDDVAPNTFRCAEHSDYGTLTLLFQDNIGGLEVRTVDDNWVPATPIPGSILVNTGDLLEFWTNGYFPATKHRVFIPEEEIKKKIARQSIVYFVHPDNSTIVAPIVTNKTINNNKNEYAAINAGEHAKKRLDISYKY